jgi:hypothetical protein
MPLVYIFCAINLFQKNAISKVGEYQKEMKPDADDANLLRQNINNVRSTLQSH